MELVSDPYATVRGPFIGKWLVVGPTFCGVRAIGRVVHMDGVTPGVVHRTIAEGARKHYPVDENSSCASFLMGLKNEMLAHGATELAVQWALEIEPTIFEEKELTIMAEKLQAKGKTAKTATAKDADKPKRAGNPEALAKAREARAAADAGPDKRKITVLKKPHGAREGTARADLLDKIYKAKTVQDAVDAGVKKSDVAWAARSEYISIA